MKKIAILLISVITLTSCTKQKIGFVNTEKLIQDYKGTKIAEAVLKEKSTEMQNALVKLESAFQDKVKKMSKSTLNRKMNELNQENSYIQQQKQQAQYTLQGESQKSLEKISKVVNDFVKKYAKDKGYYFVLGTVDVNGSVMYGNEEADITYDVLKALNNAYVEPTEEEKKPAKKEEKAEKNTKEKTPEVKK